MNNAQEAILFSQDAGRYVVGALRHLLERDAYLLQCDANERSIGYRFAMYLQHQLPDLHVDCEYNRDGVDPKKIQYLGLNPHEEDEHAKTVFPDIIAHVRGTQDNYLVIELKKSTNRAPRANDYAKLRGYKRNLAFKFALFIELATDGQSEVSLVEWINA